MKTSFCVAAAMSAVLASGCAVAPQASAESDVPVVMAPAGPPPPPPDAGQAAPIAAPPLAPSAPVAAAAPVASSSAVAPGSLDELVAPVALYPDPLLALLLPASTASSDLVLASRYLSSGGDANAVTSQPWDESVKALAHYPDVVKWMDENLAWTQRLGAAYLDQPQDVMAAVQRDRSRAQANGALVSTPQQRVIVQDQAIEVLPAQPDVIYVPRYDPEIVYYDQPVYYSPDPFITFGIGFGVGAWLAYDCDWHSRAIWVDRHRADHWRQHEDWRQRVTEHPPYTNDPRWHRWAPPPGRPSHAAHGDWRGHDARPAPMPGAPRYDGRHDPRGDTLRSAPRRDTGNTPVAPGNFGLAAKYTPPAVTPQRANPPAPFASVPGVRGTPTSHFAQPVSPGLQHSVPDKHDTNRVYGRGMNPTAAQSTPAPVVQPARVAPANAVPVVPAADQRRFAPSYARINGSGSTGTAVPPSGVPAAATNNVRRYAQPVRSYPVATAARTAPVAAPAAAPAAPAPVAVAPARTMVAPAAQAPTRAAAPAAQVRTSAPAAPRPAVQRRADGDRDRDRSRDSRANEH